MSAGLRGSKNCRDAKHDRGYNPLLMSAGRKEDAENFLSSVDASPLFPRPGSRGGGKKNKVQLGNKLKRALSLPRVPGQCGREPQPHKLHPHKLHPCASQPRTSHPCASHPHLSHPHASHPCTITSLQHHRAQCTPSSVTPTLDGAYKWPGTFLKSLWRVIAIRPCNRLT